MTTRLLLSAAAIALPTVGFAQGFQPGIDATINLGYSFSEVEDENFSAGTINIESNLMITQNFGIGFDLDFSNIDLDDAVGTDVSLEATRMAFEPTYYFGNGAYVGLYYQTAEIDIGAAALIPALSLSIELESYGLQGGYDFGQLSLGAYIGETDTDPSLPGGIDITDFGLHAAYEISPEFEVFGSYNLTQIDAGGTDIDIDLIALGAEYGFQNGLSVFGSVAQFAIDDVDFDATQFAIGVGYDLSSMGGSVPAIISAEYAMTDIELGGGSTDLSTFSIGLTIPIGNNADDSPLNAGTRVARGGSGYGAVVQGLGLAF